MASTQEVSPGRFRGVYRDSAGRRRYTPTVTGMKAARAAATVAEGASQRNPRHDPQSGRLRWGRWCDVWLESRSVEASTARSDASSVRKHLRPRWGDVALNQITRLSLQRWVNDLNKVLGPSSVRQKFSLLSVSLAAAVDEGHLDVNPCLSTRIRLPKLPQATERYLRDIEVARILHHLDGRFRVLGELLDGTGMRVGEVCGLHWHRVDLDAGTVQVIETWDLDTRSIKPYPKGYRRRVVPLTDDLVKLLWRWREVQRPRLTCGKRHQHDPLDRAGCRSGLVLTGERGAPIDQHNFNKREWAWAVDMAEQDAAKAGDPPIGRVRVHDLRHTYASRVLTQGAAVGVGIERLQLLLGHESIVTTQRYAHLVDDGHAEVRIALSRVDRPDTGIETSGGVALTDERRSPRRPKPARTAAEPSSAER